MLHVHSLAREKETESENAQRVESDSSALRDVWLYSSLHNSLQNFSLFQAQKHSEFEFLQLWS